MMLQRLPFFVAALAAYVVTVGSSLPSNNDGRGFLNGEATANDEHGIRGGRILQETVYCNTQGCSPPFRPFPNAETIACENNVCSVAQCCEGVCSGHTCPVGYQSIEDAEITVCELDGGFPELAVCTDDFCCEETKYCSSFVCSEGENAIDEECDDNVCENDQCCVPEKKYCRSFECSEGYTLIEHAMDEECDDNVCENDQCCVKACSSYHCPRHYSPVGDAENTGCHDGRCKKRQCCQKDDKVCSSYRCPRHHSHVDGADDKVCHHRGCDKRQCCEKKEKASCKVKCQVGQVGVADPECDSGICEESDCCKQSCEGHACPISMSLVLKPEAATIACEDSGCTNDRCCVIT